MPTEELQAWLLLGAMDLRPRLARVLLEELGGPAGILAVSRSTLMAFEGMTIEVADRIETGRTRKELPGWIEYAARVDLKVIPLDSPYFPPLLREIPDPPVALYLRGNPEALIGDAVGIVGTRMASRYGAMMAETIARDLVRSGMVVVSGGAVGIDAAAHRGACSVGMTVAVLGCGLDVPYPSTNQALFNEVAKSGAVVTEFGLGARPDSWRFPARNRIISGMCSAVVVVEAAEKSGALLTANFALEQGREVMAVPGQANSRHSRGCHALIRDGAVLVENAEHVLSSIGWAGVAARVEDVPPAPPPDLPMDQGALLLALSSGQKHLDELTSECGLSSPQASAAATLLEMRGLIKRLPGNQFIRT